MPYHHKFLEIDSIWNDRVWMGWFGGGGGGGGGAPAERPIIVGRYERGGRDVVWWR